MSRYNVRDMILESASFAALHPHVFHGFTPVAKKGAAILSYAKTDASHAEMLCRLSAKRSFPLEKLCMVNQIHSDKLWVIKQTMSGFEPDEAYDGMITDVQGVTLGTVHADCYPLFLMDPGRPVIALIHAGWRGILQNIVDKAIHAMTHHFQSRPSSIHALVGPGICATCYEIGAKTAQALIKRTTQTGTGLTWENGRCTADLRAMIEESLRRRGLCTDHIGHQEICTACGPYAMHSHRKSAGQCGRAIAFMGIRPHVRY